MTQWTLVALLGVVALVSCSEDATEDADGTAQSGTACEFSVGGPISSADRQSTANMLAVSEMAQFSAGARDAATESCRGLAVDLGASAADQAGADADVAPGARLQAWCALALDALAEVETAGEGTFTATVTDPICTPLPEAARGCLLVCTGAEACDASTSPATCDGAPVDARCDETCRVVAAAHATCDDPGVEVSWSGDETPNATDEAAVVLEDRLRELALLQGRMSFYAEAAASFGGDGDSLLDDRAAECVADVTDALAQAALDFSEGGAAVEGVMSGVLD